jgi:hypothetical protein
MTLKRYRPRARPQESAVVGFQTELRIGTTAIHLPRTTGQREPLKRVPRPRQHRQPGLCAVRRDRWYQPSVSASASRTPLLITSSPALSTCRLRPARHTTPDQCTDGRPCFRSSDLRLDASRHDCRPQSGADALNSNSCGAGEAGHSIGGMTRSDLPSLAGGRWDGLIVDAVSPECPGLRVEVTGGRKLLIRQARTPILAAS